MRKTNSLFLMSALLGLAACSPENASLTGPVNKPTPYSYTANFGLEQAENTFQQQNFNENEVSILFQVNKDGRSINDLAPGDLEIFENGTKVTPFELEATTLRKDHVADIVFVVDVTQSMGPFIESAKQRLKEFISTTRDAGYRTRMCFSTFGNYTVQKCERFWDNNPNDSSTEAQVRELLSQLAQLRSLKGAQDPGRGSIPENSLRALVDSAEAPFEPGSQRFVILVTDAPFHHLPGLPTPNGDPAPYMKEVTEAIASAQMKVFAVTPDLPGYNAEFDDQPSIVESSGGEFFEFKEVLAGNITLDSILDRILFSMNTTYRAKYIVDDVRGLDLSLAIDERNIELKVADPASEVEIQATHSTMPTGRPEYTRAWKVSEKPIRAESLKVYVNGKEVSKTEYTIEENQVVFKEAPSPGTRIRVAYYYSENSENLRLKPMIVPAHLDADRVKVYLNEIEAFPGDVTFERDINNQNSIQISDEVLGPKDPYGITEHQGLKIRIETLQLPPGSKQKDAPVVDDNLLIQDDEPVTNEQAEATEPFDEEANESPETAPADDETDEDADDDEKKPTRPRARPF